MRSPGEKINFLKAEFVPLLRQISSDTLPAFGKMSLQQMVEHFSDAIKIASGKIAITQLFTPEEQLPKMKEFLLSDKPFRENTPNPLMPEAPGPVRNKSLEAAIAELQASLASFFAVFDGDSGLKTGNPFFGPLNFDENVQLLYKHALHHLRQFGLTVT